MNTIIQEIVEKITKDYKKCVENMLEGKSDVSEMIQELRKTLDNVGSKLVGEAIEILDEVLRESKVRKRDYHIQRRNDSKTLITQFGEVRYERTYFKSKKNKKCVYLADTIVGINPHDRIDLSLKAQMIENSHDLSYEKASAKASKNVAITRQTVLNSIRELGVIQNNEVKPQEKKKDIRRLYIEADEDHVAMQKGTNKIIKLIYVHEGKKVISKGRNQLQNVRYFTGEYKASEDLWLEVANYLEQAYDMGKVEKIYLSGDGAKWIKEGLNWIDRSEFVLDYFHLWKYIKKATVHMKHTREVLWKYIRDLNKKGVKELLDFIIQNTEIDSKKESIRESKRYIMNHWQGIKRGFEEEYVGCSAEGHISHILSERLSSRPMGWSLIGADQMARIRVYKANKGNIHELMKKKREETKKEFRIQQLEKRVIKRAKQQLGFSNLNNIPVLNYGKKTWQRQCLKSIVNV